MDFDALKDLVKTITRNKVKHIEVLGNPGEEGGLVEVLYDAISREKVNSDEEASEYLYGKENGPKSPVYLRLKGRLERNLLNTAFFVDVNQPMFNERAKAFYNCYRDFAAGVILLGRGAKKAGIHVLEQVLEQCLKYEFVELTADVSNRLRTEYARIAGSAVMHERYSKINREYEEKRRLEQLATGYFENLVNYYIVKRAPSEEVSTLANRYYTELLPQLKDFGTSNFCYHTYQIGVIKFLASNDCNGALNVCSEALEALDKHKNVNRSSIAGLLLQKIACLIQLRMFDGQAETAVKKCLELEEEGAFNWFRAKELHLHYCLFAGAYQRALEIYSETTTQPKFESLGGAVRDNWRLYGGYLHLLAAFGKLKEADVEKAAGPFRYGKLSNTIEVLVKEKEGMNIPLMFLPVIYNLAKGTFDPDEISPEGLEKYRKRYLDNDMNRRSAAFLNLLIAYARKDVKAHLAEKKIQKELEVLAQEQPQVAGQTFAVEIVPYEDLWSMLSA